MEKGGESGCGEDLEYDPVFAKMERAAQGKPEQQYGDTLIPAEDPEWPELRRLALAVLARSKDLRAIGHLIEALLHTDGLTGFNAGLALLRGSLERY